MANNNICFLDFGAIGRFTTQTRKTIREFQYHMIQGDIGRMTNCALSLLGPLPPLDVEGIRHEIEKIYADAVYAMNSDDVEWWEKSAAQGWLRFLGGRAAVLDTGRNRHHPVFPHHISPTTPLSCDWIQTSMSPRNGRPTPSRPAKAAHARVGQNEGTAAWPHRHGLSEHRRIRRHDHPILLPIAAKRGKPNHPLPKHCRQNCLRRGERF